MHRPVPPGSTRPLRPSYARTMRRGPEPGGTSAARAVGVLLTLLVAALVLTHGVAMASDRAAAERTLRSVLPALIDLDQALASHPREIAAAADAGPDPVALPGLPLTVEVARADALAGGDRLRAAAVADAASTLYQEGPSVFRAPDAEGSAVSSLFTSQWSVRRAFSLLTERTHERFGLARLVAAVLTVAALLLFLLTLSRDRWLIGTGSVVLAGAIVSGLALVVARVFVWFLASGGGAAASAVTSRIARDVLLTAGAVAGVAAASGVVMMLAGVLLGSSSEPRGGPREQSRRAQRPVSEWEDA
jgi:hypothetical protein